MQMEISGNCAGAPTWRAETLAGAESRGFPLRLRPAGAEWREPTAGVSSRCARQHWRASCARAATGFAYRRQPMPNSHRNRPSLCAIMARRDPAQAIEVGCARTSRMNCIRQIGHGASVMLGGQIRALRSDRTRQCRCSRPVDIDCPLSDTAGFAKHRTFGDSDKS
jgi:hypothetical protein